MDEVGDEDLSEFRDFLFKIRVSGPPDAFDNKEKEVTAWIKCDPNTHIDTLLRDMSERSKFSPSYVSPYFIDGEGNVTYDRDPSVQVAKWSKGISITISNEHAASLLPYGVTLKGSFLLLFPTQVCSYTYRRKSNKYYRRLYQLFSMGACPENCGFHHLHPTNPPKLNSHVIECGGPPQDCINRITPQEAEANKEKWKGLRPYKCDVPGCGEILTPPFTSTSPTGEEIGWWVQRMSCKFHDCIAKRIPGYEHPELPQIEEDDHNEGMADTNLPTPIRLYREKAAKVASQAASASTDPAVYAQPRSTHSGDRKRKGRELKGQMARRAAAAKKAKGA